MPASASATVCSVTSRAFHLVDCGGGNIAKPHKEQAQRHRKHYVCTCAEEIAVAGKIKRLQAEGGKGGEAAAQARHDKLAGGGTCEHPAIRPGKRGEEANYKRAQYINDERAQRKSLSIRRCDHAGKRVTRHTTQRAANGDPEIHQHITPSPLPCRCHNAAPALSRSSQARLSSCRPEPAKRH